AMIPAAITPTRSDARSLNGRGSSDSAPHDDGFDAALAQAAPDSATAKPSATGAAPAPAAATDDAAQGLAALLAKLASGTATAPVDVEAAAQG
ncbi:hypothetical protein NXG15_29725, partial [Klebsiella pneumoniae]|nr:hypothetical protein [Klebsiella pneumoniae]